jgi:hypothetical protein
MQPDYPDNEEVLAAYNEALVQCRSVMLSDIGSQLQQGIENVKNGAAEAKTRVIFDYHRFELKVCQVALQARKMNPRITGEVLIERWNAGARELADRIAPTLLFEATSEDRKDFHHLQGIDVFFSFLSYFKKDQKMKVNQEDMTE